MSHQLEWLGPGRVVLALDWDSPFPSRPLDFELLRREAARRQQEIAVISPDFERRRLARSCGFPAFGTVDAAQQTHVWASHPPERINPPPAHWWDAPVEIWRRRPVRTPAVWFRWLTLLFRLAVFAIALTILIGTAYIVIPSAKVTLVPAGQTVTTIVAVSMQREAEGIDHGGQVIPARRLGVEVEGYVEVETTGTADIASGYAAGEVLFTNLLAEDYLVRAGTTVRTSSSSYPVRFRTTADVMLPASGQATAPVEALQEGVGNVGAFQINQVEGVAGSAVRVTNPTPTSGAEPKQTRVVDQADYDRAKRQLTQQLLDQAYSDMLGLLDPTEILLRQSLRIEAVPKETYSRFITEQADSVGLNLRLLVSGLSVDVDDAESVAYQALVRRLPEGHMLVAADFELGEVAEEDIGYGDYTIFVTAHGYAATSLDVAYATSLIRGQRVELAMERLNTGLELAEDPRIEVNPTELRRLPVLPLRITISVLPAGLADEALVLANQ
ncbi:MAG: hypothetical protein GX620_07680 [Chloroflexi bacterium]|nr:hypothetical protein [Chloroflexota bacterium]